MISIYYNKGRNCLDSQLFGHFYERVTRKIFDDKLQNFISMKWIWKAHRKKVYIGFTQFVQYRPKMTGFIIICEGLSLAKCEKKDVRESYSQNLLLFLTS